MILRMRFSYKQLIKAHTIPDITPDNSEIFRRYIIILFHVVYFEIMSDVYSCYESSAYFRTYLMTSYVTDVFWCIATIIIIFASY